MNPLPYLYKNWAKMCLPLAFYITLLLVSSYATLPWIVFLIWLQFPVYLIHEFEEHAWPGGFKNFVNREVFGITNQDKPLNDANIFWINIPAIWILFPASAVLAQNFNPSIGAILPVFGLFNATLHLLTTIIKRKYNPGLFVSTFVNYPTGIYTLLEMHRYNLLTPTVLGSALLITFLSHAAIVVYAKLQMTFYPSCQ